MRVFNQTESRLLCLLVLLTLVITGCTLSSLAFKKSNGLTGTSSECVLSNASMTLPVRAVPLP